MRRMDKLWFILISEVLVNLSAGWIGVGVASIFVSDKELLTKFGLLTVNLSLAILSIIAAFRLRKRGEKR